MAKDALTLEDCFQLALAYNDQLKIAGEDYIQAVLLRERAWSAILPNVSLRTHYSRQETAAQFGSLKERREEKISLEQPLFQGFQEFHAFHQARHQILSKGAQLRFEKAQIFSAVSEAFYEVLKLESTLQTLDSLISNQRNRLKEAKERFRLNLIRKTEVLLIETDLEDARARRVRAQGELKVTGAKLGVLVGLQIHQRLIDQVKMAKEDSLEHLLEKSFLNRDDLKSLSHEVKIAHEAVSIAMGRFLPTVTLLGNLYLHRDGPQEKVDWDASIGASLPIFEGGENRTSLKEATSKLRQAEVRYELQKKTVVQEVTQAHAVYESLGKETSVLKKKVRLAEENYTLAQEEYRHGLATHLEVQIVYQQLIDAKLAFEQARWNHKVAQVQLQFAYGGL